MSVTRGQRRTLQIYAPLSGSGADVAGAPTLDNDFGSRLHEKRAIIGVALWFTLLATVTSPD
jgi:hypothetical protein